MIGIDKTNSLTSDALENYLSEYTPKRKRLTNYNVSGNFVLDLNKYDTFDLVLIGNTVLSVLPAQDTSQSLTATVYLTGDFSLGFPQLDHWNNGQYNGATSNRISMELYRENNLVGDIQTRI